MADLKSQIKRRLSSIGVERERLQRKLAMLGELEKELRTLLSDRSGATGRVGRPRRSVGKVDASATAQAIQRVLKGGAKTKQEVANVLSEEGFDFGGKAPARVVHLTISNMRRHGTVEQASDGKFSLQGHSPNSRNGKLRAIA